jgi:hypothetical protein
MATTTALLCIKTPNVQDKQLPIRVMRTVVQMGWEQRCRISVIGFGRERDVEFL